MLPLEAPHDEMTARERLEMLGERRVDRRAADRADDRRRLGRELLADDDAEARRDLGDEPRDERRRLGADALGSRQSGRCR